MNAQIIQINQGTKISFPTLNNTNLSRYKGSDVPTKQFNKVQSLKVKKIQRYIIPNQY